MQLFQTCIPFQIFAKVLLHNEFSAVRLGQYNSAEVQQCRKKFSSTVPKMKTLFSSAKNLNKFKHIKYSKQKLNGNGLES